MPSRLFDGGGSDSYVSGGVGFNPIWYVGPNPRVMQTGLDYLCDVTWGRVSAGISNLVGGGPEDPATWVWIAILGALGGEVCAVLDPELFHEPMNLMKIACGDVVDAVCGQVFDTHGLGFLGVLICPAFSAALCPLIS